MQGSAIGRSREFDSVPLWIFDVRGRAVAKRTVTRRNPGDLYLHKLGLRRVTYIEEI